MFLFGLPVYARFGGIKLKLKEQCSRLIGILKMVVCMNNKTRLLDVIATILAVLLDNNKMRETF